MPGAFPRLRSVAGCFTVPVTWAWLAFMKSAGKGRCQISWEYDGAFPSNRQLKTHLLAHIPWGIFTQTGITSIFFIPMTNVGNLRYLHLGQQPHLLTAASSQLSHTTPQTLHFHINNTQAISAEGVQALQKNRHIALILKAKDIPYTEPGSSQSHFYSLDLVSCADIPGALVGIQDSTAQTFWLGTFYGVEKEPYISPDISQGLCSVSVKGLYLQLWHLRNLNADTFQSLTRLQKLDLTQPHIHALPPAISGMSLLEEMPRAAGLTLHSSLCQHLTEPFPKSPSPASARDDLSSSHINTSIQHVFQGLKNLMFLDLSQNNFDLGIMPKDKLFQLLSNLEVLILKLQHVDLNYNKFTAFSTDAFSNPKSINLSCVHNRTHTVSNVQLVPLDGHLIINLSYDLLDCSWSKIDLITYLRQALLLCSRSRYEPLPAWSGLLLSAAAQAYLDGQTELCWWYDPPVSWSMHHGELAQYHSCCVRLELLSE
ncbi:hypothetical protein EK904_015043, partial [Melospiza melodia maxima]